MIPNQWYVVLESKQVTRKPLGVTRMGEKLVFWRDQQGKICCLRDRCVHRGVRLSKGKRIQNRLQCPFHGFEYDTSGKVQVIPANGRGEPVAARFQVQNYPAWEEHGLIWIWWGTQPPSDLATPKFFPELDKRFHYTTIYDPWQTHYSRVIENQLDVVHLPFIHHNTIGRGHRTVIDGPIVQWLTDEHFRFFVYNRMDDGNPARSASKLPDPDPQRDFHLDFIFPNLWLNNVAEDARILGAFVPVDDTHTLLYLRFYQRFLQVPLLRDIVGWLAMPFNRLIAHQDRLVVQTHQPPGPAQRGQEQLIPGDRPIIEYRRKRQQLLEAARLE